MQWRSNAFFSYVICDEDAHFSAQAVEQDSCNCSATDRLTTVVTLGKSLSISGSDLLLV